MLRKQGPGSTLGFPGGDTQSCARVEVGGGWAEGFASLPGRGRPASGPLGLLALSKPPPPRSLPLPLPTHTRTHMHTRVQTRTHAHAPAALSLLRAPRKQPPPTPLSGRGRRCLGWGSECLVGQALTDEACGGPNAAPEACPPGTLDVITFGHVIKLSILR